MAIIFDTETTGLPQPNILDLKLQPKIVEFAAIKIDDKTLEEVDRFEFLANPKVPMVQEVINIHKITNEMVQEQPEFGYYFAKLTNFFFGEKYLFAHNIQFDISLLKFELQRLGRLTQFPWPPIQICTVNQTLFIKGYRLKLGALYEHLFSEQVKEAHRAMPDVENLTKIVRKLITDGTIKFN